MKSTGLRCDRNRRTISAVTSAQIRARKTTIAFQIQSDPIECCLPTRFFQTDERLGSNFLARNVLPRQASRRNIAPKRVETCKRLDKPWQSALFC